jgi:hypothetical protein
MKTRVRVAVAVCGSILVAMPGVAFAQPGTGAAGSAAPATAPCPPNAALAYWRAWNGRMPAVFENAFLEQEMRTADANWAPNSDTASALINASADIERLIAAANMDWCDWGVPLATEGFNAPLPHLAKMRVTARVLIADARRLTVQRDSVGAARRVAAVMLMGRHVSNDKTVYSVRSGQSIAVDMGMAEARRLGELGALTDESRRILQDALKKIAIPDPFGMLAALQEEPVVLRDSIKRTCTGPDAVKTFVEKFMDPKTKPEERAKSGIDQLGEAELHAAAERMAVAYLEVVANWDSPDAVKQIRALQDQKKAGDYGPVGALTGSDLGHMRVIVGRLQAIAQETMKVVNGEPPQIPTPNLKPLPPQ